MRVNGPWSVDVFNTASSKHTLTDELITDACCIRNQSRAAARRADHQRLFSSSVGVLRKLISSVNIALIVFSLHSDSERVKRYPAFPLKALVSSTHLSKCRFFFSNPSSNFSAKS
ncbi:hypothetical protein TNCV_3752611 [Trichonephila clavipes]|nr:hypothetical protein TNCV_3752611 [Trichonephila clavipes]